jgi:hypothetical protein
LKCEEWGPELDRRFYEIFLNPLILVKKILEVKIETLNQRLLC